MFSKEETENSAIPFVLDFHNDVELAKRVIFELLLTVYNQPQECVIGYVNNISGYTMQEQGIEAKSGCGFWTWFWVLVVVAVIVWIII